MENKGERALNLAQVKKHTENWVGERSSVQDAIYHRHSLAINRARDLASNTIEGSVGLRGFGLNLIGDGVKGSCYHGALGDTLDGLWRKWCKKCDFYERENFDALLRLIMNEVFVTGGCFVIKEHTNRRFKAPLALRVIPVEYLYDELTQFGLSSGEAMIKQGIQYDSKGRVDGYWLHRSNPKDVDLTSRSMDPVFVPVNDCLLVCLGQFAEVVLPESMLNAASTTMLNFDEYKEANLMRAKVANCFAAFIEDTDVSDTDEEFDELDRIVPAMMYKLPPGKKVTVATPPKIEDMEYSIERKQEIAASLGVTYEFMTGDYSKVNFTSARIARDDNFRYYTMLRTQVLVPKVLDKVWEWFLEACDLGGLVDFGDVEDYGDVEVTWTFPALPFIQPEEELKALDLELDLGVETPSGVLRRRGKDPEKHFAELKEDIAWIEDKGLGRYFRLASQEQNPIPQGDIPVEEEEKNKNFGEDEKNE
jgi:lambda family phage portal protein